MDGTLSIIPNRYVNVLVEKFFVVAWGHEDFHFSRSWDTEYYIVALNPDSELHKISREFLPAFGHQIMISSFDQIFKEIDNESDSARIYGLQFLRNFIQMSFQLDVLNFWRKKR
jgi:hypothetical protein